MAELSVDLTYGEALYQAAVELDKTDQILNEGSAVLAVLKGEPDLCALLEGPYISAEKKRELIDRVFHGRVCQEVINFLCVLVDKGRIVRLSKIMQVYGDLISNAEGIIRGRIVSAVPLSKEQVDRFEQETGRLLRGSVILENETDPSILGGVKIYANGKVLDASLQKRLEELRSTISRRRETE